MIGIGEGIGYAIIIALLLLSYVPFVTVFALKEIGVYKSLNQLGQILAYVFSLILFGLLTLLTIRSFPYVSLNWLILYSVTLTIILIVNIYKRRKGKKLESF